MAPQWRRLLNGEGRCHGSLGGDGRCDDELRVMQGAARRRGSARDSDADSMRMCDEEPCECDGNVDVDTAGGGSNKGQRDIKL